LGFTLNQNPSTTMDVPGKKLAGSVGNFWTLEGIGTPLMQIVLKPNNDEA